MLTLFCLMAVVVLLVLHEYLLADRARGVHAAVRRTMLIGMAAAAVAFGERAQIPDRVQAAVDAWRADASAFEMAGDPFLRDALSAQRPEQPFPPQGPPDAVRAWQRGLADTLRARAGLPAEPPSSVALRVLETVDLEGVRRTLLEFTSWDGTRIPAYVHQPSGGTQAAAVLVVPGHGHGIRATSGIIADYQHAVAYELARRGYVTLTAELRGFGLLAPGGTPVHDLVAHAALEAGSFYKAVVARDLQYALTVLQHWEGADPSRLAVAGTSLGGEVAVFLAGLDPRPSVVVSHSYGGSAGATSVPDLDGDRTRRPPHGCHTVPGANRLLVREDWFRLLAPRAVQVIRGREDVSSRAGRFEEEASAAWQGLGSPERFEFSVEPGDHEFFVEPAVRFLERWL